VADQRRLGELGEDDLIAAIVSRYRQPAGDVSSGATDAVRIGPGDDAAVLDVRGPVVVSTDTVVEGYDFRREWSAAQDVGVKVAAQNLADVAAMGARPLALVVSVAVPSDLPADWATGLADGLEDECCRAGAQVVGGDVSEAGEIVITGTAIGVLEGPAVRRGPGRLGPSAAGLALLMAAGPAVEPQDAVAGVSDLLAAHRAPRPPYPAGPEAARAGAHALIDTSDGLLRDAARLAVASGVRIDLDPAALAPDDGLAGAAALLGSPEAALTWVLTGGEDHALLATFSPGTALPPSFRAVGRVTAGAAQVLFGGRPWPGSPGWTHFHQG
jgi:thiamine-monophosphate kinase